VDVLRHHFSDPFIAYPLQDLKPVWRFLLSSDLPFLSGRATKAASTGESILCPTFIPRKKRAFRQIMVDVSQNSALPHHLEAFFSGGNFSVSSFIWDYRFGTDDTDVD
jgi:hypothetical protein